MASRKEELKIGLTAQDSASTTIDQVADKVEALASQKAAVELEAEDNASPVVEEAAENVEGLDGETAEAELTAEDEATEVVEDVTTAVEDLDGATAEPTVEAEDLASEVIDGVSVDLSSLEGESATVTIEAEDNVSDVADEALTSLEAIDDTFTATIESEGAEDTAESAGGIAESLSSITGGSGLAALSAAGFFAIAQRAADAVLEVDSMARATGATLDEASRLKEAWELAGGSIDTLERNMIRANERIRESPELANALGIQVGENTSAFEVFVGAVNALNSGQLTSNERLRLAMELFGSRGVLMLDDLQTRVGDLDTAMAGVGDNEIITQADVDAAIDLQNSWDAIEDFIGKLERTILPGVASTTQRIAELLDTWPVDKLLGGFEALGAEINLIEAAVGGVDGGSVHDIAEQMAIDAVMVTQALEGEVDWWTQVAEVQGTATDATVSSAEAAAEANEITQETIDLLEEQADALDETADKLEEQGDAYKDLADATDDYNDAVDDLTKAGEAYNDAADEFGDNSEEAADALDDVRQAAEDVADAQVAAAEATAAANGTQASAIDSLDLWNSSMLASARTMNGEARTAILQRIADVNAIPTDVMTEIEAAIADGDLEEADRLLDEVSAPRRLYLEAELNRTKADAARLAAANLATPKTLPINPALIVPKAFSNALASLLQPRTLNIATQLRRQFATGTAFTPRGVALVGEQGPELVSMEGGESVTNAGRTAELLRNGAGAGTTVNNYVTNNWPRGMPSRDVAAALRRQQRIQAAAF